MRWFHHRKRGTAQQVRALPVVLVLALWLGISVQEYERSCAPEALPEPVQSDHATVSHPDLGYLGQPMVPIWLAKSHTQELTWRSKSTPGFAPVARPGYHQRGSESPFTAFLAGRARRSSAGPPLYSLLHVYRI